jgi:DNA (cytosine-5)-methyltransferase 1
VNAVSLFSGIGGFDLGFERAGIETVLQVEINKHALVLLERHWPLVERITDVRGVGTPTSGGVDLIYGGFPCQDISVAGKRAGLSGERSGLWFEFARILEDVRPRWCVIENVAGLLSSGSPAGGDLGLILDTLVKLGYGVAWRTLDAQFFGVPQQRRRVFVVGHLGDPAAAAAVLAVGESSGWDSSESRAPRKDLAHAITGRAEALERDGLANNVAHALTASQRPRGDGSDNLIAQTVALRGRDGVGTAELGGVRATALRASSGGGDKAHVLVGTLTAKGPNGLGAPEVDGGYYIAEALGVRRLTPLECERLQGFPDGWTAGQADTHRYHQLGNAVCVVVAEWIGHRLVRVEQLLTAPRSRGST